MDNTKLNHSGLYYGLTFCHYYYIDITMDNIKLIHSGLYYRLT